MSGWGVHDVYQQSGGPIILVSWIFWVIFSITLHELAHGWAAIWQGDDTPVRHGRMTMNPLVHMGWPSLIMFALIGIAWGMMPVNPNRFRWRRWGDVFVSGAGPAMNILLAVIALTSAALWQHYGPDAEPLQENVTNFLFMGGWLNLLMAAFNLLPIPPLDGSSILMGLSRRFYRLYQHPQAQMVGMFVLLAIFLSGIGGLFFGKFIQISHAYVQMLVSLLPAA